MRRLVTLVSAAGLLLAGCSGVSVTTPTPPTATMRPTAATPTPTPGQATHPTPTRDPDDVIRYVALGDSYTIGTGVKVRERWPNQLTRALRPQFELDLVDNLAVNGATTYEIVERQLPFLDELEPGFVTLLIGVNDVIRDITADEYRANLVAILDGLLAQLPASRILVVSSPDYTLTPHGSDYGDPAQRSAGIAELNAILAEEVVARGITVVDISPVSDLVDRDPTLLADDELHPSGKQYAGWVELIAPTVRQLLAAPGAG